MSDRQGNPFWEFSLRVYQRDDVAARCIGLQERLGLDVNLLLLCCWTGSLGHQLREAEVRDAIAATAPWQSQVVAPLRVARRHLKENLQVSAFRRLSLRERIRDLELDAERIEQDLLFEGLTLRADDAKSAETAALNLSTYLLVMARDLEDRDLSELAQLLDAIFPAEAPASSAEPDG